ncbi:VOC family protein [Antribacter gilvus]|uniref:VOC family protein n=1 Tax=Antribacter gilvus TaxID=2304675 RepID=UPI001F0BC0FB|nr:VOC family protein [Antribacter gilvus]
MTDHLAPDTSMQAVTLHVEDLDLMTRYYRDALLLHQVELPATLALTPAERAEATALGRDGEALVILRRAPGLPRPGRGEAGLFHTAVLFDDAAGLAAALASVATTAPSTFTGSADHLVSEAFYFTDPEGNGVELYHDRPRDSWGWDGDRIRMASLYLDPDAFLRDHLTDQARELVTTAPDARPDAGPVAAAGAVVGHVHLQVGDVPAARGFYVDALGFEETFSMGTALFVSAGGYHHHMAMNTWNSRGAGPRASTLGLATVGIQVPAADDVAALRDRLTRAGVAVADDGTTLRFDDPWSNHLEVRAATSR